MSVFSSRLRVGRFSRRLRQPWRWFPFGLRLSIARLRAWLVRRRVVRRIAVIVSVSVVAMTLTAIVGEARRVQDTWGVSEKVVIAGVDLEVGDPVETADLSLRERPLAFLPPDALVEIPSDSDVAVRSLRAGEVVTNRDLRSTRDVPTLPAGHRAMSLPLDASVPHLEAGNLVELHLVNDRFGDLAVVDGPQMAIPALVVEVTAQSVVLAVEAERVSDVATTQTTGRIVVALR